MGTLFDIKHYAIHDGPGIRTTVFMKGCPLECWWCHNPESRSGKIFCFSKKEKINGQEVETMETVGKTYSVQAVMNEVEKDVVLYEESGGGVTISGGEPFFQYTFLLDLVKKLKQKEYHTCIDTTGHVPREQLVKVALYTDFFLYDIKQFNNEKHLKYTGVSNKLILDNLVLLDELGKEIEIRYPLIPTINDDESDLLQMLAFLQKLKRKYPINILPYHKIGSQKYQRFGITHKMDGIEEPSKEQITQIKNLIELAGFEVKIGG